MSMPNVPNGYRVLDSQGRVSAGFKWPDPSDQRDVGELLLSEGLAFGEDGAADPTQRLNALELARSIEFEIDPDELSRLQRIYGPRPRQGQVNGNGDQPWLVDGKSWHLMQASPKSKEILEFFASVVAEVTGGSQPNWGQKYYISWSNGSRIWMSAHPRKRWVWLALNRPKVTGQQAADRLGWILVPYGEIPSGKSEGPAQVQASLDGSTVWLQLRMVADLHGQTGSVIRELITDCWTASQPSFV
jgi:hypothetical protein